MAPFSGGMSGGPCSNRSCRDVDISAALSSRRVGSVDTINQSLPYSAGNAAKTRMRSSLEKVLVAWVSRSFQTVALAGYHPALHDPVSANCCDRKQQLLRL